MVRPRASFCRALCLCAQVMSYAAARAHIRCCMQIAGTASSMGSNFKWGLAQHYDEIARKEWERKAARGDAGVLRSCFLVRQLAECSCAAFIQALT